MTSHAAEIDQALRDHGWGWTSETRRISGPPSRHRGNRRVMRTPILLTCLFSMFPSPSVAQTSAGIGDPVPDFEFQDLIGHDGRTRLSELLGKPVLIAGWRTHMVDGIHAARVAVEVWQKHGDDALACRLGA